MTAYRSPSIFCDYDASGDDCQNGDTSGIDNDTVWRVRDRLRRQGWDCPESGDIRAEDYCPEHRDARP